MYCEGLLVALAAAVAVVCGSSPDYRDAIFTKKPNNASVGETLRSMGVDFKLECAGACLSMVECEAFSVKVSEAVPRMRCELHKSGGGSLQTRGEEWSLYVKVNTLSFFYLSSLFLSFLRPQNRHHRLTLELPIKPHFLLPRAMLNFCVCFS